MKSKKWTQFFSFIGILGVFVWVDFAHANQNESKLITYFSSDYLGARKKFLEASREVGAHIESFKVPVEGPAGEPLYTDVASIKVKEAKTILVLGSGTHGVEGFAGSGIQTGLLREGIVSKLRANVGVVMIHAINPYGFAHLRRFNEDNVDLNRNFVDHTKPYPKNEEYKDLADAISPSTISLIENAKSLIKLFWYGLRKGKGGLQKAISGGQYSHAEGLFYGGNSEAWSNKTLREIAKSYLLNAKGIVFIDFHTGLGSYGEAEIIMNVGKESPSYTRAVGWWGDRVKTTAKGESVSTHITTALKLAFPEMVPNLEVTAVSLEFGTVPATEVFWALRAENWLHHHGDKNHPDAKKIKAKLLRAFYPDAEDWKLKVWDQGNKVVAKLLANLQ